MNEKMKDCYSLGIELGSTRIKAVVINEQFDVVASGSYEWENQLVDGTWTYALEEVWKGIQSAYQEVSRNFYQKTKEELTILSSIGISAMMHGYLPFDKDDQPLCAFRTWRNTTTEKAAEILTNEFIFNVPQRWSIAHLYQAILDKETHVEHIHHMTTLAGYVHYQLTGEKIVGVGEASGMFPIDARTQSYNKRMMEQFSYGIKEYKFEWSIESILPTIHKVGECAGTLSKKGARLLDPTGLLKSGVPFCPPEGDAQTGMVATNSIQVNTGNVSAGTSIFAMVVLEKELSRVHMELDVVSTPTGIPVAMVHCNNCTSDLNAYVKIFGELLEEFGVSIPTEQVYLTLFKKALDTTSSTKGLVHYNYLSGESITQTEEGRPLFVRHPNVEMKMATFMRSMLYSALATLKIGMDILVEKEGVVVSQLLGHGGFFKNEDIGQIILASALETPIVTNVTAGEGGPWGMAILASYMVQKEQETLEEFLHHKVFMGNESTRTQPQVVLSEEFKLYMKEYSACINVEKAAISSLR